MSHRCFEHQFVLCLLRRIFPPLRCGPTMATGSPFRGQSNYWEYLQSPGMSPGCSESSGTAYQLQPFVYRFLPMEIEPKETVKSSDVDLSLPSSRWSSSLMTSPSSVILTMSQAAPPSCVPHASATTALVHWSSSPDTHLSQSGFRFGDFPIIVLYFLLIFSILRASFTFSQTSVAFEVSPLLSFGMAIVAFTGEFFWKLTS
mmetsp:Transcript_133560/g.266471  ORF Transcript_133560/g.266471 Transcript_133560/m.266471 type:complete len:202 (+) Transcript_133560:93-698(+)